MLVKSSAVMRFSHSSFFHKNGFKDAAPFKTGKAPRRFVEPVTAANKHKPQYYPDVEEDEDVLHHAFHAAYDETKPEPLRVPGLQEFAAAIWQRRTIPSQSYSDPLMHLFQEFDTDDDGVLEPQEIAKAFRSHQVDISTEQVQRLIDGYEEGRERVIRKEEWVEFVHSLAVSDLHLRDHYQPGKSLDNQ